MAFFGCHLSPSAGLAAAVQTAASLGADTFQYFTRNPRGSRAKALDPEDCRQAERRMEQLGFGPIVAHGAYTMNLCTKDPEGRAFAAGLLADDLQRVAAMHCAYYNFHPGSHVGQGVQIAAGQIAQALEAAMAQQPQVTVLLETMAGKGSELGGSFSELRLLLDAVQSPMLHVCLDTCHVWDGGYDIAGNLDGVLEEFDRIIGLHHLKALHLNDSLNPLGARKDRHARLGEGCIGLDAFAAIVRHSALRGLPMILETPNELPGYAREIRLLRDLQSAACP